MQERVECDNHAIEDVRVGKKKESLDVVGDYDVLISDVIQCFGRYLKYHVRDISPPQQSQHTRVDAFSIMMAAQRSLGAIRFPPDVVERNKRDALYNDLLSSPRTFVGKWKKSVMVLQKKYTIGKGCIVVC